MKKVLKYILVATMAVSLVLIIWAMVSTPEVTPETVGKDLAAGKLAVPAIEYNLYWGYVLMGVAILAALFAAVWDMVQKPEAILSSVISLGVVVAIVLGAWFIASGHDLHILDLQNHAYFSRNATVLTEASVMVTYVVFGGAILAAIYSAVSDAFK